MLRGLFHRGFFVVLTLCATAEAFAQKKESYEDLRRRLVNDVLIPAGIKHKGVLKSMLDTPRHEFCAPKSRPYAYNDVGLPIGDKQTISSPFIVAYMTEALDPQPTDKVLEIGTGSGFQAAILSPLVKDVYSIEIVESLGKNAAKLLEKLHYKNIHTKVGDGYQGWTEHAPFDKIIVTCSPEKPPQPLIDQLKEGGLMVIPAGERFNQMLYLMTKKDGKLEPKMLIPTLFVPMTGRAEETREKLPDPAKPVVGNGDFEAPLEEGKTFIPGGWYYERGQELVQDSSAPQGKQYIKFKNDVQGRWTHILQGFPVDAKKIAALDLSMQASCKDVAKGREEDELPMLSITFYNENVQEVSTSHLGPFMGTQAWKRYESTVKVPSAARSAIVRIGMFGATGETSFDDISMRVVPRK